MSDTAVLRHYLAPILPLLEPVEVTELVINKPGEVGIEDHLGWHWHNVAELDSEWLATLAVAAASFTRQDVNAETPICSTILPGGERCQIVIPSVTPTGAPSFTVRNTIAPMAAARDVDAARGSPAMSRQSDVSGLERPDARRGDRGNTPNDRAADSQMRVMEAVIRRTLFDNPEAVARVMTVARTQLDAHIAAGRNIRPAMVKDAAPSVRQDIVRSRDPATPPIPRPGREPKPQERSRSR